MNSQEEITHYGSLRERLQIGLGARGVKASPQAINSMVQSVVRSNWEYVEHTDSLLVGLLCSGSYTMDILAEAGANIQQLRHSALHSVYGPLSAPPHVDLVERFLSGLDSSFDLFSPKANSGELLETADFLRAATSLRLRDEERHLFPIELRRDAPPKTPFLQQLECCVCDMIGDLIERLGFDSYYEMLTSRTQSVTDDEDRLLDIRLGHDYRGMNVDELEFSVAALNAWFVHRSILIQPEELCLRTVKWWENWFPFGTELITESNGDLRSIDIGLQHASRLSPERDLGGLVLISRDGKIQAGEYTYRNSVFVDTKCPNGFPIRPVSIQAVRPVSLISAVVMRELEFLLSKNDVRELEIQRFLELNPEILESLGYAQAHPHICLSSENSHDLIPDFLLELPGQKRVDILDLKLPSASLVARSPYPRMSSELAKAVAQLRQYASFFESADNRKKFHQNYGLSAFRPQLGVVIGRSSQFASPMERIEIEQQLGQVRLFTFDDLIAYGNTRSILFPPH